MTAHPRDTTTNGPEKAHAPLASFMRISSYIIVITAIISTTTYVVLSRLSPEFRAETTILIEPRSPTGSGQNGEISPAGDTDVQKVVGSQLQLLRSRDLARTVTQTLNLERRPAFESMLSEGSLAADILRLIGLGRDPTRLSVEERTLEAFADHLSVSAVDDGHAVSIAFTSRDPRLAADVANAVAAEYIALQRAVSPDPIEGATSWLGSEIASLTRRIDAVESKVEAYRVGIARLASEPASPDPSRQRRAESQLKSELRTLENKAAQQRKLLDSYLRRYREALARRESGFLPVDTTILSRASPPVEVSFPRTTAITAMIAVLAFLIMIAFVIARKLAQGRALRHIEPIPIPEIADTASSDRQRRWTDDNGVRRILPAGRMFADNGSEESIRSLVATIAASLIGEQARRIMVVTAGDACEVRRPLAAVALARALAAAKRRAVLIELRDDGAVSANMGEAADLPGFSDLFAGEASFGQAIFRDRKSRAHFIPSGQLDLSRSDLADDRIGLLVGALDHTYDHVVLDVSDDFVNPIGAECNVVVVATAENETDARTARVVERIRSVTNARIVYLRIDPPSVPETFDVGTQYKSDGKAA